MSQWIDWDVALGCANTLMPPGPRLSASEASKIVGDIRRAGVEGLQHAEAISLLKAEKPIDILVVDRSGWAKALSENVSAMLPELGSVPPVVPVVAGAELGAVLSVLGTRVLGQFDPLVGPRLLLNAPTITQLRTEMNLNAQDFYLWIATHEQTHRLQFEAAPWIEGVMKESLEKVFTEVTGKTRTLSEIGERVKTLKGEFSELTSIMSVLEGHAMAVMNDVDSISSIKTIQQRFAARGENRGVIATWVGKLIGLDAKAKQYVVGEKFVRHVVQEIGYQGFNQIFTAREMFPDAGELEQPEKWLARVR